MISWQDVDGAKKSKKHLIASTPVRDDKKQYVLPSLGVIDDIDLGKIYAIDTTVSTYLQNEGKAILTLLWAHLIWRHSKARSKYERIENNIPPI